MGMRKTRAKKPDDSGDDGSGADDDAPKPPDAVAKKKKKPPKEAAPVAEKPKKRKAEPAEKPAKKKRKKKDPNAPKGKSSAYIMFGNATRAAIREQHPEWSLGDVGRELGKRWKELDDAAKAPFVEKAQEDTARYDREMKAYKEKLAAEGAAAADDADSD